MELLYVVVQWSLAVLVLGRTEPAGASACRALDDAYARTNESSPLAARVVSVYGSARRLVVAHDAGAASRAAAALQRAVLRALVRYRDVALAPPVANVCHLAEQMQWKCDQIDSSDEVYNSLVISPSIAWHGYPCSEFETCLKAPEVPPRMQAQGRGAAPAALRLHAQLVAPADARSACAAAALWDFYGDLDHLYDCSFIADKKIVGPTLATVYTLGNRTDLQTELIDRITNAKLYLSLKSLADFRRPRNELLRLLKERKSSFLFLDYDIWDEVPGVYKVQSPPPTDRNKSLRLDPTRALRLADDFVLRPLAPQALRSLQSFSPSPRTIREVLEIEAAMPELEIEEAACTWAADHKTTFESWHRTEFKLQHSIAVFLCVNDPDKDEYKKTARAVETIYSSDSAINIQLYFVEIDCRSDIQLSNEFIKTSMSYRWQRLIGAVAAGEGARAAAALAPGVQTALVLYDQPAARVRLGDAVRATSGTLHQLVAAIRNFLHSHEWTRLALLSDESELAKDLFDSFRTDHKLTLYNSPVNGNISNVLQHLRDRNARIIFVNTLTDKAQMILCAAHRLGMVSPEEYVWILREWRHVDLECNSEEEPVYYKPNITYFTISYSWRGGNLSQFISQSSIRDDTSNALLKILDELWPGATWPQFTSPLADSLELLIKSFKKFVVLYPERYFDLHGNGSVGLLLDSLKNDQWNGIIQSLNYVNGSLAQPFVFVDKWHGNQREPLLVWRIQNGQLVTKMNEAFGKKWPSDGTRFCLTNTSNDLFNPQCYDYVWFTALSCLIVVLLALYLARRIRLKHLAKRDSLLRAKLMAQRELVSHALQGRYVDRAALELYDYLGKGQYGFGRVRYAILGAPERPTIAVAVKELREDVDLTEESELLREACTLATLSHDHIVRLIGVCTTGGPLLVLIEYAFFGNLCEYLCERRHLNEGEEDAEAYHVSSESLTRLAMEVASAISYLAIKRIVHRDIRARNCLIDARRSVKLANFGLARKTGTGVVGEEEYLTRRRGLFPVLWMAPESLERGAFSAATDVWALGVLLLEVLTLGARPYGAWPPLRVVRYVSAGGQPPLPYDISETARQILMQCWRRNPEDRLTAAAVLAALETEPRALKPAIPALDTPADEVFPAIQEDVGTIRLLPAS